MSSVMNVISENVYRQLIDAKINSVHLAGIATKILQHMDRVRNVSDLSQARRWVMELLQNAGDVAYDELPMRVRIQLTKDTLTFSHNGKPFRVQDILSIINQVSSKSGDDKTVGKFGTGFVTTFQLSERVEIHSVLQEGEHPYKRFQVTLDRKGRDNESILAAISQAMEELREVDNAAPVMNFEKDAYNTEFLYHLETEDSRNAAKVGLEDLQHSVFYILLFKPQIKEITLEYDLPEKKETVTYRCVGQEPQSIGSSMLKRKSFEMCCKTAAQEVRQQFSLIYMTKEKITLAAGWTEEKGFVELSSFTPRIFIDFPLIGAENFPFPIVIGSSKFQPNEPRSGITLVDNSASQDALVNKALIGQAVEMYDCFLQEAVTSDLQGIENILYIPAWQTNKEMSEQWVYEHIYRVLYNTIAQKTFLVVGEKKRGLVENGVCLIAEEDVQVRKEMTELFSAIPGMYAPTDEKDWYSALCNYPVPVEKCWTLQKLLEKAEKLIKEVSAEPLQWLQKLYNLGCSQENSALLIRTGKVCILPNQSSWEDHNLYTVLEVKRDPQLPEILKDTSECLDELQSVNLSKPLYIRKQLLHKDFNGGELPELTNFEKAKLEGYLMERTSRTFRVQNYNLNEWKYDNAWRSAWMKMLSCGPDKEFYELGRQIWKEELPEYQICEGDWNSSLWRHSYIGLTELVINTITECDTLNGWCQKYFETEQQAIDWLNVAMKKCREYYSLAMSSKRIFLNQKGQFCYGRDMQRDGTENDVLKDIAAVFADKDISCDFRERLLDRRIETKELQLYCVTEEMIAQRINQVLQQILREQNLADTSLDYQMACTRLLQWMNDNEALAGRYFPAFANEEDKVRLMTPNAVIALQKRSVMMDKVMKKAGVDSVEELLNLVEALQAKKESASYFGDMTVFYGDEFDDYEEEERRRILREIGIAGEKYALERVKSYFVNQGYVLYEENNNKICLQQRDGKQVTIYYGDYEEVHQAGWDIRIVQRCPGEDEKQYFVEVKTHTLKSRYRGQVALSREQMRMAVNEGDHYIILSMDYDFDCRQCVGCSSYVNPLKCFAKENRLQGQDKYFFYEY